MKMAAKLRTIFPPVVPDHLWKSPVNLSIGLHILVTITTILMPMFVDRSPRLPEFYTVNLLNVAEVAEVTQPATPAQIKPPTPPKVVKESAPVAVSEQKISTAVSEPVQVISIKPVKKKIRRAEKKDVQDFEKTKRALQKRIKETELAQKRSQEEAAKLAGSAVDQIRRSLQTEAIVSSSGASPSAETRITPPAAAPGPAGAGIAIDQAMKHYLAALFERIQSHWYIPPLQNWEDSLEAILVIKINRNGTIAKTFFEKKSANLYFNQFVSKTVQESAPLPPFPRELDEQNMEIGLRFSPAGIY
jgi:outer membrane biosynthesis protein TonB